MITRENLIKAIYDNDEKWSCTEPDSCSLVEEGEPKDVCMKCAERMLDRYEQEIRAKVLEKITPFALCKKGCTSNADECYNCMYEKLNSIESALEELKEQKKE